MDDGSMDASAQICDHYAQTYPELIQVIHKENEGLGMARNTGIRLATGEYIAFLDSDDAVEPEMYEEMYAKAIEDQCDYCNVRCENYLCGRGQNLRRFLLSKPRSGSVRLYRKRK